LVFSELLFQRKNVENSPTIATDFAESFRSEMCKGITDAYKSDISRERLSNEHFVILMFLPFAGKIGFDAVENEPSKVCKELDT